MEYVIFILIFILKIVVITLFVDAWLYWLHVAFHSSWMPYWLGKYHIKHHDDFKRTQKFSIHIVEATLDSSLPCVLATYLFGLWFCPIMIAWGVFEASRGHGQYKWFKLIPRSFYKKAGYIGTRYHMVHHTPGMEHHCLSQMLKWWDILMGTGKPKDWMANIPFENPQTAAPQNFKGGQHAKTHKKRKGQE